MQVAENVLFMEEKRFRREEECELNFRRSGKLFNANTPENHPLVFSTTDEFKAGMSILAISARMFPDIKIYAFQLMSNHIHSVIGGEEQRILEFFEYYRDRLDKYFGCHRDFGNFKLKLFPINDLSYLRNAIVYVNRNGFVVNNDVTPFSYPWGSSQYYFQSIAAKYLKIAGKSIGVMPLRTLMHSRYCDALKDLKVVDGYVSPLEFCDFSTAESFFRDAKQYFYLISRKVEAYSDVAKSIGEAIFYNDNDLFTAALMIARESYGVHDLRTLPAAAKMEMARRLHFDYNASAKQLQRLLSVDAGLLAAVI